MFSHFRHSEKTPITPQSLPPTEQTVIKPPPSPFPFSPPPPPAPAEPPSLSESFRATIKAIILASTSAFLKPSNISSSSTPNRRLALASTNYSSFDVFQSALPPQASPDTRKSTSVPVGLVVGVAVAVVLVLFGLGGLIIYFARKKNRPDPVQGNVYPSPRIGDAQSSMEKDKRDSENGNTFYPMPNQQVQEKPDVVVEMSHGTISFDDLVAGTNGFSQDNLLGRGGFGEVFKGTLNGMDVAVKKLRKDAGQGEKEFYAEVDIISRVHHKNLVSLVGHCIQGDQRLLVYEFVANRTLDSHLRGNNEMTLSWQNRYKIAVGAAKGLAYLHEDCSPKIIHRDIKASNILLDLNFEPKVADFGLAKFQSADRTHVSTRIMGTFGYIAPEFATSGRLTDKADVYAFGVVLLELITGRPPATSSSYMDETLVGWARPLLAQAIEDGEYDDLIDPRLGGSYDPYGMARMIECASSAVRQTPRRRPSMIQIVQHLQGEIVAEDLHTSMPPGQSSSISFGAFSSGTRSTDSGISRLRTAPRGYASSEYSDQSGNQSGLHNTGINDTFAR